MTFMLHLASHTRGRHLLSTECPLSTEQYTTFGNVLESLTGLAVNGSADCVNNVNEIAVTFDAGNVDEATEIAKFVLELVADGSIANSLPLNKAFAEYAVGEVQVRMASHKVFMIDDTTDSDEDTEDSDSGTASVLWVYLSISFVLLLVAAAFAGYSYHKRQQYAELEEKETIDVHYYPVYDTPQKFTNNNL
eukprot:gene4781-5847_t